MAKFLDRIRTRASDSLQEYPDILTYLTKTRKLPDSLIHEYQVGYTGTVSVRSEDTDEFRDFQRSSYDFKGLQHRALFPVTNCVGGTLGFSTRRMRDDVDANGNKLLRYKTLLTDEAKTTGAFFGIERAMESILDTGIVYVVEGAIDCMTLSLAFPNVVSSLTSKLNAPQYWTLSMLADKIVIVFDDDAPGKAGAEKALEQYGGDKKLVTMDLLYHDANTALQNMTTTSFIAYAKKRLNLINFRKYL